MSDLKFGKEVGPGGELGMKSNKGKCVDDVSVKMRFMKLWKIISSAVIRYQKLFQHWTSFTYKPIFSSNKDYFENKNLTLIRAEMWKILIPQPWKEFLKGFVLRVCTHLSPDSGKSSVTIEFKNQFRLFQRRFRRERKNISVLSSFSPLASPFSRYVSSNRLNV